MTLPIRSRSANLMEQRALSVLDYQSFMRPVLAFAADGNEYDIKTATSSLADQFGLTEEERAILLPSGKQTLLANRVHWAITYLAKAGALERTRRANFRVTDRGRKLLEENPHKVGVKVLQQFPEFLAFQEPSASSEAEVPTERPPVETKATVGHCQGDGVERGRGPATLAECPS